MAATAFLLSCVKEEEVNGRETVSIGLESKAEVLASHGTLDLFIYNMDNLQRLDSHSRMDFDGAFPQRIEAGSRGGMKKAVVLANWPEEELKDWSKVHTLTSVFCVMSYLGDDNPGRPRMTGTATVSAGSVNTIISMQTLSARIKIASLQCDFSGRAYAGETIKNARVYLTNVCTSTTISPDDNPGYSFANIGGLSEGDMEAFGAREMLCRKIYGEIGPSKMVTDFSLYCYPASLKEERPGQPVMKLVLEGEIGGKRYYYPVPIGEYTGGKVNRNTTYQIDLLITRLGTDDPEAAVAPEAVKVGVQVLPWEDTSEQTIDF